MGTFSISHWIIVLAVVLLLFGAGKVPRAMGDLARGLRAFRAGLKEEADESGHPEIRGVASPASHPPETSNDRDQADRPA